MLLGLHRLLRGELLHHLDEMGHGDAVAICDGNFPAYAVGQLVVDLSDTDAPSAVSAVRTVFPVEGAPTLMSAPPGSADQVQFELITAADAERSPVYADRYEFYEHARGAYLIIRTGETRPYGNVILTKGVVEVATP